MVNSNVIADNLIAYKSVHDLPPLREIQIQVDQRNEAILIPMYGCMVPFHVANVKSVSTQADTSRNGCYIRIIFNTPVTPFSSHETKELKMFLKEITFRSKDLRHISEVVQQIKTLKRNVGSLKELNARL